MGIYIGHGDQHLTFKALFHHLDLATEGYEYNYDTINLELLIQKLEDVVEEHGELATIYEKWMEDNDVFVYGYDETGKNAFAGAVSKSALEICRAAQASGETTMSWG